MRPCLSLPFIALLAATIAGCSSSSSTPGMGGIGGVNTPDAGTSNPEATLYCRMQGTKAEDFFATDAVGRLNPLGIQMEGKCVTYVNGYDYARSVIVDFFVVPVPGTTYTVGQFGSADAAIAYSEQRQGGTEVVIWQATGGTVKVESYNEGILKGTFECDLAPNGAGNAIEATGGQYSIKVIQ